MVCCSMSITPAIKNKLAGCRGMMLSLRLIATTTGSLTPVANYSATVLLPSVCAGWLAWPGLMPTTTAVSMPVIRSGMNCGSGTIPTPTPYKTQVKPCSWLKWASPSSATAWAPTRITVSSHNWPALIWRPIAMAFMSALCRKEYWYRAVATANSRCWFHASMTKPQ